MGGFSEELGIDFDATPRDILIFVLTEVKNLRKALDERDARYESRLKKVEDIVDVLRISRLQVIAGAGVMGAIMAALMKIFWPGR